jgi:hypothetical protein
MKNENFQLKVFAGLQLEVERDVTNWLINNSNIHIIYTSQSESMTVFEDELMMNLTVSIWFCRKAKGVKPTVKDVK